MSAYGKFLVYCTHDSSIWFDLILNGLLCGVCGLGVGRKAQTLCSRQACRSSLVVH